jgi:hypothetical protein
MKYVQVCYIYVYKPTLSEGLGEYRRLLLKCNDRYKSENWIQVADPSAKSYEHRNDS